MTKHKRQSSSTIKNKIMTRPVEIDLDANGTGEGPTIIEPIDTDYDISDLFETEAKGAL